MVPSFSFYWNRRFYWPRYVKTGGPLGPGQEYVMPLHAGPPVTYNVTVEADGPIRIELVELGEGNAFQDWGTGTYFSRTATVFEEANLRIANPALNGTVRFEITLLAETGATYPIRYLPGSLPYLIPLVFGRGCSRRDRSRFVEARRFLRFRLGAAGGAFGHVSYCQRS
ncbi:MAG: hypothetical protein QW587_11150 [Candidatus Bathyarchaeia archaeon]